VITKIIHYSTAGWSEPGVPETLYHISNLETSLPATLHFHTDCHHAQWLFGATSHTQICIASSLRTVFIGRLISCSGDITWTAWSLAHASTDDLKWWIQEWMQGIRKETLQHHIPSFMSAEVYWMTRLSPTRYHIQTVMINMNSHGHRVYLSVLLKLFHLALIC
jgi:hypothetical protein